MPAVSQQRTVNNRGQIQLPNQRTVADLTWLVTNVAGVVVTIEIDAFAGDIFQQTVPQFDCDAPAQLPTSSVLAGTTLTLIYPAALDPGAFVTIPSAAPGVRSKWGGFLAAGRQTYTPPPSPPPALTELDWSVVAFAPNLITLLVSTAPHPDVLIALAGFTTTAAYGPFTGISFDGTNVLLTVAGVPLANDDLTFPVLALLTSGPIQSVLLAKTVVL